MKNLHIENSYKVWSMRKMKKNIIHATYKQHKNCFAENVLHRNYLSMYIEWWLHNVGYYTTLPFIKNEKVKEINLRFKHVDLEEWRSDK